MSFAAQTKAQLCSIQEDSFCCKNSLLYGLLICANMFGGRRVRLMTEHPDIAGLAVRLLKDCFSIDTPVSSSESGKRRSMRVDITDKGALESIMTGYGYGRSFVSLRVNRSVFACPHCTDTFLRGVFLSCGTAVNPDKEYHLELVFSHLNLSRDISALLAEQSLPPKSIMRGNSYVLYYKDSGELSDFLTLVGAHKSMFEVVDTTIYKELRNNANRLANCETANIGKTVSAAASQIAAINLIISAGRLEELPEELRKTALLRIEHQDISLGELGAMLNPPVTKSGINHRIRRLMQMAEELDKTKG